MLIFAVALLMSDDVPQLGSANERPAFECAEHVTDDRARRNCLDNLLAQAESELAAAHEQASEDARESDLDSGSLFHAEASLDHAQEIWVQYRDAECTRRGALMFVSDASRAEIVTDCRIALDRARAQELLEN